MFNIKRPAFFALILGIATSQSYAVDMSLFQRNGCLACHSFDKKILGPAFKDIAAKYSSDSGSFEKLVNKVKMGGSGTWGPMQMPPNSPHVSDGDIKSMVQQILGEHDSSYVSQNTYSTSQQNQGSVKTDQGGLNSALDVIGAVATGVIAAKQNRNSSDYRNAPPNPSQNSNPNVYNNSSNQNTSTTSSSGGYTHNPAHDATQCIRLEPNRFVNTCNSSITVTWCAQHDGYDDCAPGGRFNHAGGYNMMDIIPAGGGTTISPMSDRNTVGQVHWGACLGKNTLHGSSELSRQMRYICE